MRHLWLGNIALLLSSSVALAASQGQPRPMTGGRVASAVQRQLRGDAAAGHQVTTTLQGGWLGTARVIVRGSRSVGTKSRVDTWGLSRDDQRELEAGRPERVSMAGRQFLTRPGVASGSRVTHVLGRAGACEVGVCDGMSGLSVQLDIAPEHDITIRDGKVVGTRAGGHNERQQHHSEFPDSMITVRVEHPMPSADVTRHHSDALAHSGDLGIRSPAIRQWVRGELTRALETHASP